MSAEAPDAAAAPEVVQASSAYLLRSYQVAVDLLKPRLHDEPDLRGGQRVLGQALARLSCEAEAVDRLREAIRQSTADWLARVSLASLLLRAHDGTPPPSGPPGVGPGTTGASAAVIRSAGAEARAHLEAAFEAAPRPALRELLGAAHWQMGQESLRARQDDESVPHFAVAAAEFAAAAEEAGSARLALPERQSAAFVGQAVGLLLTGQTEAAQRLFSRSALGNVAPGDPLGQFAVGVYELCDALAGATTAERLEATEALREVVLATRLHVGFYDGTQPVSLVWFRGHL